MNFYELYLRVWGLIWAILCGTFHSLKSISKLSVSILALLNWKRRSPKTKPSTDVTPQTRSTLIDELPHPLDTGRSARNADTLSRYPEGGYAIGQGQLFVSGGVRVQETDFDFADMEMRVLSTMSPEEQAAYRGTERLILLY